MAQSPFFIKQDFLSPTEVSQVRELVKLQFPDTGPDGYPIMTERTPEGGQKFIFKKLESLIPQIESHYGLRHRGFDPCAFQQFPAGMKGPTLSPRTDSHHFSRKKWVRVSDKSLTGFIWLVDANSRPPFNPESQVSGGKLEFPQYNFGFDAQAGTLVLFPATPYFVYAMSPIAAGTLNVIKITESAFDQRGDFIWSYDPAKYPLAGKNPLEVWFKEFY